MKHVLFAGSFDPPTWGHIDIIQRAVPLCDKLTVGLAVNTTKSVAFLSHADRMELLEELCREFPRVSVVPISGLVAQFVKEQGISFLLRSLRSFADFEKEEAMALANRQLIGVETLFLLTDPRYSHISSTLVREIANFGGSLDHFVPPKVVRKIYANKIPEK